jgi:hypothetical protein
MPSVRRPTRGTSRFLRAPPAAARAGPRHRAQEVESVQLRLRECAAGGGEPSSVNDLARRERMTAPRRNIVGFARLHRRRTPRADSVAGPSVRHRHGRPSALQVATRPPSDSVYFGSVQCVIENSFLVGKMQNGVDLLERYREQADKFAGLARVVALAAVFAAGAIPVEDCRIVPGFFGSTSRRVCEPYALAFVLARKVDGAIRSIVLQ